jgi:hypothetical protein
LLISSNASTSASRFSASQMGACLSPSGGGPAPALATA